MFDIYHTAPSHVSKTVHEHQAPTDASVKLLKEMEEKAEKKLLSVFKTSKDNFLQGVVVHRTVHNMDLSSELVVQYTLNGEEFEHIIRVDEPGFRFDKDRALYELAQAISDTVTSKILYKVGVHV